MNFNILKNLLKSFLRIFNLSITKHDFYEKLKENRKTLENYKILLEFEDIDFDRKIHLINHSNSELKQDFFVLKRLNFKKDGYFVEFGSCNGVEFSNTLMLEREFGWKGILAEPARCWHYELKKNRDCNIETNCVWKETGVKLIFKESELALNEGKAREYLANEFDSDIFNREPGEFQLFLEKKFKEKEKKLNN